MPTNNYWHDDAMSKARRLGGRAGQTMLLGTLSLVLFFSVLGLAVDMGWSYFRRHAAQAAADSAALAAASWAKTNGYTCGVNGVVCGTTYTCAGVSPPTDELQAGCLYAAQNGFSSGVTMTSNSSGSPVAGNSPSYWVQANIAQTVPLLFLSVKGFTSANVNVQAVAGISITPPNSCIYVLDSSAAHALDIGGTAGVTTNCAIYVNSSASNALRMVGNATITGSVFVVGQTSIGSNDTITPAPTTGVSATPDPLSSLSVPSYASCDHTGTYNVTGGGTLGPGVYCGGISVSSSAATTFSPGNYYLVGGGLSISGSGNITANNVTFFNTGNSTYSAAPISITGSGVLNMSASTTGAYQGIMVFQDRTHSYSGDNKVAGTTGSTMSGTFYFPTTSLTYTGTSTGQYSSIIANTIVFTGTSNLSSDTTGHYTYISSRIATLFQ